MKDLISNPILQNQSKQSFSKSMKCFDEIINSVYNVASCVPVKLVQNNENKRFWKDIVSKLITLKFYIKSMSVYNEQEGIKVNIT